MTVRPAAPLDAEAVLPLALVKQQVRVTSSDDDVLLEQLRLTALSQIERVCGRSLQRRAWTVTFDRFADTARLPIGPVSSVTGVSYLDAAGAAQAVLSADWRLSGDVLRAASVWPFARGEVTVTVTAGWLDAKAEAPELVTAALMLVAHWYQNREAVVTGTIATALPLAVDALISTHRAPVIG
ncbi:head-tail connector protein [Sphingomonas sp.]|uniref:head-tail connector protein n=1 Tax=Sphingomonas sp. TaxID=28214 RepID=UPI002D802456|nr:head-tail connector protein [Sphingomonas sp.]HEU0045084.1 head-tail connector protein [Sphingomonas sp.]